MLELAKITGFWGTIPPPTLQKYWVIFGLIRQDMEWPVFSTVVADTRGAKRTEFREAKRAGTRVENEPPEAFEGIEEL